jgi:hypothetical protein
MKKSGRPSAISIRIEDSGKVTSYSALRGYCVLFCFAYSSSCFTIETYEHRQVASTSGGATSAYSRSATSGEMAISANFTIHRQLPFLHVKSENGARVVYQNPVAKIICENRSMLGLRFSPVYPPIFICVFHVGLFFVTILLITNKPPKPADQVHPVGYKHQDDERHKGDQASCRVVG